MNPLTTEANATIRYSLNNWAGETKLRGIWNSPHCGEGIYPRWVAKRPSAPIQTD